MQVTHVNTHITHAVIGGAATIDFGISNSAEFFNILSSTLYKDQLLAVVREVLCNAWDAHIEAGCTDIPVQITLTKEMLVVKDFGKGIHRDDIGPIYGTYGGSTKKNDGTQTGGFGLGCKAPFAYTDHFEVTSAHDGIKTIYNMSKSSAQAEGKPGILPIASFPTQESGLQVSIRVKDKNDYHRFLELVKTIAHNGDMNMVLNESLIDTLGFDSTKNNYIITREYDLLSTDHTVMIRYGNVVYPVDENEKISANLRAINHHLNKLNNQSRYYNNNKYRIVFQALPHSIAVTPSRESLSMQDHTCASLNSLFKGFLDELDTSFVKVCDTFAEQSVATAVKEKAVAQLLNREAKLPGVREEFFPQHIPDMETMAKRFLTHCYPAGMAFRTTDISRRLTMMAADGLLDRGLVHSFLREIPKNIDISSNNWMFKDRYGCWLQKKILAPLLTKLVEAKLDHKRLYVLDRDDMNTPDRFNRSTYPPITLATSARPANLFNSLPYLRNIVVVSLGLHEAADRCNQHEVFKKLGDFNGCLFYHASKKLAEKTAALEFFNKSGMVVVDLTGPSDTFNARNRRSNVVTPLVRKAKKKGLVCLSSVIYGAKINTALSRVEEAKRVTDPEFVITIPIRQDLPKTQLNYWDSATSRVIVDLFGAKGGVVNNIAMEKVWVAKGAKKFDDYLMEKLCHHISTSPTIHEYWAYSPSRVIEKYDMPSEVKLMLNFLYTHSVTRAELKVVNNLTEEDKKYLQLWQHYVCYNSRNMSVEATQVKHLLNKLVLHPVNESIVDKLKKNIFLRLMDVSEFTELVKDPKATPAQISKAFEILLAVLKN